jgi:hypothetical protein
VTIPKLDKLCKKHLSIHRFKIIAFLRELVSDVHNHVTLFIVLGLIAGIGDDFVYFNETARWFRKMAGLFRVVFCGFVIVASGLLMLSWAHVYHASKRLTNEMSRGVKVAIGLFYASSAIQIIGSMISYWVIAALRRELLDFLYSAVLFVSVGWLSLFGFGFLVYGIMIYLQMRRVITTNLFKLKLMRIMIVIDILFITCLVWLSVLAVDYMISGSIGWFLHIFKCQFLDAHFLALVAIETYVLSNYQVLKSCRLYKCCTLLCVRYNSDTLLEEEEPRLHSRNKYRLSDRSLTESLVMPETIEAGPTQTCAINTTEMDLQTDYSESPITNTYNESPVILHHMPHISSFNSSGGSLRSMYK